LTRLVSQKNAYLIIVIEYDLIPRFRNLYRVVQKRILSLIFGITSVIQHRF